MNESWISKALTGFSTFFAKNFRITLILFVAIIVIGYLSYSTFLKREGSPAVEIPIAIITTPYFANDMNKVDDEVTRPIETAISDLDIVEKVQSITNENFSNVVVSLTQGTNSEDGAKDLQTEIDSKVTLPEGVEATVQTISAGAVDGSHDILLAISNPDKTVEEMTLKAKEVAEEIQKLSDIKESEAIELYKEQTNPITKKTVKLQTGYNRVGTSLDGKLMFQDAINIGVIKAKDSGLIDASDAMHERIDELIEDGDLDGYEISYGGDFAVQNKRSISDLESNALSALIAVAIILFFFLNWRASIIAIFFIPTVLAATFAGLYLIGYDLNFIVLFGVILVLGLLVDDAIVVAEAVDYRKREGKKGLEAVKAAIGDVGVADMMGTITTLLVFAPMAFISGILGDFIKFIPITVMIALVLSLIIALSLTAFMSRWLIPNYNDTRRKKQDEQRKTLRRLIYWFPNFIRWLSEKVGDFVSYYLRKTWLAITILVVSLALVAVGGFYASKLKFSTFPEPKDSSEMFLVSTIDSGKTIDEAAKLMIEVEDIVIGKYGSEIKEVNYMASNESQSFMYIQLTDMDDREITSKIIADDLNEELKGFQGASVKVNNGTSGPHSQEYQFFIQVISEDQTTLENVTSEIKTFLTDKEINDGEKVGEIAIDYLSLISKTDGKRVAQVKAKTSDPENTGLIIALQDQVKGKFNADKLATYNLEEDDLSFDQGLEGELMGSFNSALFALLAAIAVMYLLLVIQYNSFALPFLILLAIPFTFAGLFPGLYFTDNALSFFVMIGIIALSGIVVNNTILVIDFANKRRKLGMNIADSISGAIKIRFRPIIITSATTIVALFPLSRDPFWESLTYSIIFGLIASTILVVTAFPVYYAVIEKIRGWKGKVQRKIANYLDA